MPVINPPYVEDPWLLDPVEEEWDISEGLPTGDDRFDGVRYVSDGTSEELGWYDGYIYEWHEEDGYWEETLPIEGMMVWLLFEMVMWVFFSGGWMELGSDSYWSLTEDQMGLTGDKSGDFDLTTTGDVSATTVLTPTIKTDTTTPTDLTITCGADKTLVLTETVWDDLPPSPIIGARLGSSAPTLATFVGNVEQYTFDATNDYVIGATEITHKWKEGTTIYPHIHWATNGTNANDRGVKWSLEYTIGDSAEAFAGAATTVVDVTIPLATADRTHLISDFDTAITGTNYRIGAYICWRLSRVATAHANGAPAADPFGLAVGFHAECERIGSRTMSAA